MKDTIKKSNGFCMPMTDEKEWIRVITDQIQKNQYKISNIQERAKRIQSFNSLLLNSKANLNNFILELSNAAA